MQVSYGKVFDVVFVEFENITLRSVKGHYLSDQSKLLNSSIPRQMIDTEFSRYSKDVSETVSFVSKGTTVGSITVSFVLTSMINELLKTYQPLQLLLHLPILEVWFPANVMSQFKNFVPIVNFDLMNELKYYTDILEDLSKENKKQRLDKRRNLVSTFNNQENINLSD